MPDLKDFESQVNANIKLLLRSKDPTMRLKAAQWLGEAGEPSAITALTQAYKNDTDARVRGAARYSLGMFRALEQLWNDDEDKVLSLLEDIAVRGKMGRRLPVAPRTLVKVQLGLVVSLLLLLAINFVLIPLLRQQAGAPVVADQPTAPAATDQDRGTLLATVRSQWTLLGDDVGKLQRQFEAVRGGGALNCTEFFNLLNPIGISANNAASFPEVGAVVTDYNAALSSYARAKAAFDQACDSGAAPSAEQAGEQITTLQATFQALPGIGQALAAAEAIANATPTLPPADAAATDIPLQTATAVEQAVLRTHVIALQDIIDRSTDPRGPNGVLRVYWQEAQQNGITGGCRETPPNILADYVLPPEVAQTSPELDQAASNVNTGLQLIRQGWQLFSTACSGGNPGLSAATGLQFNDTADQAFANAESLLAALRG